MKSEKIVFPINAIEYWNSFKQLIVNWPSWVILTMCEGSWHRSKCWFRIYCLKSNNWLVLFGCESSSLRGLSRMICCTCGVYYVLFVSSVLRLFTASGLQEKATVGRRSRERKRDFYYFYHIESKRRLQRSNVINKTVAQVARQRDE